VSGPSSVPAVAQSGGGLTVQTSTVVVEFYTSQGCSSCPPADAYLGELARRSNVIALALHVDYWNYIGWSDPFSSETAGRRQYGHQQALGTRSVYTPQMVVDGQYAATGLNQGKWKISSPALACGTSCWCRWRRRASARYASAYRGRRLVGGWRRRQTVWLFIYDDEHATDIEAGENSDCHLINYRVARWAGRIGDWRGGHAA
jgi:hypothetical protein